MQALLSAALSCLLAVPAARALARRRFPGRAALVALLGAPFLLPAIVAVFGIVAIWGRAGLFSRGLEALGAPGLDIYGLRGVVLAHVFFNVALVARLVLQGWLAIPAEQFRLAAQLGFAPGDVFRRIEAPMLRDVLPGAFVLVFLLCMTSFAVALTLGGGPRATTVELAIYQALRFDFDLGRAAWLALIQFALCGSVGARGAAALGRGRLRRRPRRQRPPLGRRPAPACARSTPRCSRRSCSSSACRSAASSLRGLPALAAGLPAAIWPAAARSLGVALGLRGAGARPRPRRSPALIDARRARGGGRWLEAAGLMTLAASPFVIGTGLFILLYPLADPFALALPVTATVNAAMALPFVLRALLPALAEARSVDGRLADSLGIARPRPLPPGHLGAAAPADGLRRRPRRGAVDGRPRGDRALRAAGGRDAAAPDAAADGRLPDARPPPGVALVLVALTYRALLGLRPRRADRCCGLRRSRSSRATGG